MTHKAQAWAAQRVSWLFEECANGLPAAPSRCVLADLQQQWSNRAEVLMRAHFELGIDRRTAERST